MTERAVPRVSDQINEIFARPLLAFREKLEQIDQPTERGVVIPRTLFTLSVPQFRGDPGQELLDGFPHIYDHNISGREFIKISDGTSDDGFEYNLAAPVGEYGEDPARRLISAAYTLRSSALNIQSPTNILDETEQLIEERQAIYENTTSVGQDLSINSFTPFTQGIQSVLFTAGIFTARRIEGFGDAIDLMDELTKQKIFSKYALFVPSTITARMGDRGWLFTPNPLDHIDNKFSVSQTLIEHYTGPEREKYKDLSSSASKLLDRRGCPAARTLAQYNVSSIDLTAQLLVDAMRRQKGKEIKFVGSI